MTVSQRRSSTIAGLLTFLLFLGVVLIAWLVLWPEYSRMQTARDNQILVASDLEKIQQELNNAKKVISDYNNQKDKLEVLERALPPAPQVPQILADLEDLASRSGVELKEIRVTEKDRESSIPGGSNASMPPESLSESAGSLPKAPELVELKVDVSASATYDNFRTFLDLLEKNMRLFDVQVLTSEGAEESLPSFSVVLSTFYQRSDSGKND